MPSKSNVSILGRWGFGWLWGEWPQKDRPVLMGDSLYAYVYIYIYIDNMCNKCVDTLYILYIYIYIKSHPDRIWTIKNMTGKWESYWNIHILFLPGWLYIWLILYCLCLSVTPNRYGRWLTGRNLWGSLWLKPLRRLFAERTSVSKIIKESIRNW